MPGKHETKNPIGCLLIESDVEAARLVETACRKLGTVDVRWKTTSFNAGLEAAREHHPEMAIVGVGEDPAPAIDAIRKASREFPFLYIVALSGKSDSGLILSAMRAGAHDFLCRPVSEGDLAATVGKIENLKSRKAAPVEGGRIITLFSSKGGNGSTTIAANLADALVRHHGKKVVVVDLALVRGDVSVYFNVKPAYSILDLARNAEKADYEYLDSLLMKHRSGVSILAEPPAIEDAEMVLAAQVKDALNVLRAMFDYIIVDTPHQFEERTLTALEMSSSILLISLLDLPSLRNAQRCLDLFERLRLREGHVRLLLNRYLTGGEITREKVEGLLNQPVFFSLPNDYPTVISSVNRGRLLSEVAPDAEITESFRQLADALVGHVVKEESPTKKAGLFNRFFGRESGA